LQSQAPAGTSPAESAAVEEPTWGPHANRLERALVRGDIAEVRAILPAFLAVFGKEPLLFKALADGGHPRQILRVRVAQTVLRALASNLPRLGLERESYHLLRTARAMEQANRPPGRGITQFNELFQASYQAVVEAVVAASAGWDEARGADGDRFLSELLEQVTPPFLQLWMEHSRNLQLSALEVVRTDRDW